MSKQRQRDRAAREAAASKLAREAANRAAVEARRRPAGGPKAGPAPRSRPRGKQPVYRQRRFPPLPWRLKAALALGWLIVLALTIYLVPGWQGRIGLMVVATFCLPLIVVIARDPSRRTDR